MSEIPSIDPRHAILLVMDYQPAILSRLPGTDELLARMAETIKRVRESGTQVGYVRVAFTDADQESIPDHNTRFKHLAKGGTMRHGLPEAQIHPAVAPEPGDVVVRKTRVGPFTTTDLDHQLRERHINTLILAGISTSGVVLSTVREAADRDYRIYVLDDVTADGDAEVHRVLTQKVFPRQAYVISTTDLPNILGTK